MPSTKYKFPRITYRYLVSREENPQKILLDTLSWDEMMAYITDNPDVYLIDVCYESGARIFGYRDDTRRISQKEESNND